MTRARRSTVSGVVVAALLVGSPAAATSSNPSRSPNGAPETPVDFPRTETSSRGVEVTTHGVLPVRAYQESDGAVATLAVHAVQRVDGGTVVYLSVGSDNPESIDPPAVGELMSPVLGSRYLSGAQVSGVRVVEREANRVLSTLLASEASLIPGPLASPGGAFPQEPGQMGVLYAVVPELDPGTESVDVQVGLGLTVPDVPVGDGLLEPLRPSDQVVPLGTGWPEVDLAAVAAAPEPQLSVHPLTAVTQALDRATTTLETPAEVSIDVAADVLFAFDSAELTDQAGATVQQVADDIAARATGTVRVVGHTDAVSDDAYNDDLSLRRAQAVAQLLTPAVERAGLQLTVEGRGEREPVADNDTDTGRQANRRVTVSFTVAGEAAP